MTPFEEKKQSILRNSMDLFARRGYYGTGLSEILAACGIPKGSFYYYFPRGKEELGQQVVYYAYESMEKGIRASIFSVSDDAKEVFCGMARHLARRVVGSDRILASLLMTFLGIESIYISEEMSRACQEVYRRWQALYYEKLMRCGYGEAMARALSQSLFALIHGSLISSWIKQSPDDLLTVADTLPLLLPAPEK